MLLNLQIRNFAIVDEIEVDFGPGMTVLTGETGAGKSILVDALGLILGERGGTGLVRAGAERAEFSASFDVADNGEAREWLESQAMDLGDDCVLRRVIGGDGRSRAFINGNAAPLQSLKSLGRRLADIHGQHFHQSLVRRTVQRDLLDYFAGNSELRNDVASAFGAWREACKALATLRDAENDRESRLDLLTFQLDELDALDFDPRELENLELERLKLQNAGRIADGISRSLDALYDADDRTAQALLVSSARQLEALAGIDPELQPVARLLDEAGIQVAEAVEQLRRHADSLDADPARRDWVEERLHRLQTLARKHRVEPEELGDLASKLRSELDALRHSEERGAALEQEVDRLESEFAALARDLSKRRQAAAERYAAEVTSAMAGLGMPGGRFELAITELPSGEARGDGMDEIEYRISASPGQGLMPLSKVASGGELSRMGLAIQVVASDGSRIPTMVFDEVDSGVGGAVAEMVGRQLRSLGGNRQVLCVTHLPQVASQADHHLRINKVTDGRATRTGVCELSEESRIEELARMLGGVKITARTRDHAAEMLAAGRREPAGATASSG